MWNPIRVYFVWCVRLANVFFLFMHKLCVNVGKITVRQTHERHIVAEQCAQRNWEQSREKKHGLDRRVSERDLFTYHFSDCVVQYFLFLLTILWATHKLYEHTIVASTVQAHCTCTHRTKLKCWCRFIFFLLSLRRLSKWNYMVI